MFHSEDTFILKILNSDSSSSSSLVLQPLMNFQFSPYCPHYSTFVFYLQWNSIFSFILIHAVIKKSKGNHKFRFIIILIICATALDGVLCYIFPHTALNLSITREFDFLIYLLLYTIFKPIREFFNARFSQKILYN